MMIASTNLTESIVIHTHRCLPSPAGWSDHELEILRAGCGRQCLPAAKPQGG